MKNNVLAYAVLLLAFTCLFTSCQEEKMLISFTINTENPNPFGWPVRFDTILVLGGSPHELTAGKTNCGAWVAYRHLSEQDSTYEFWVDQDNDGMLNDEKSFTMHYGERRTGIKVLLPKQPSYDSLPYSLEVRGNPVSPYVYWKPNYRMDGMLVHDGDTAELTLWDTDANGIFERNDARGGFNLIGAGISNINAIRKIGQDHYLLDTLMPDGTLIVFQKTKLKPATVGEKFPNFKMTLLNGERTNNRDNNGKWTMYNFFPECIGSTCRNLEAEMREYEYYLPDSIRLVSLLVTSKPDDPALVQELVELDFSAEVGIIDSRSELWLQAGSAKGSNFLPPFRLLVDPAGEVKVTGSAMNLLFIGQKYPSFTQIDSSGRMLTGADFKGSPLLIDFWASWCEPCIAEVPTIKQADSLFSDRGLKIVMISYDSKRDAWLNAIDQNELPGTHLTDLKGWDNAAGHRFGVLSIPYNFLINKHGIIVDMNLRGEALIESLQEMINQSF